MSVKMIQCKVCGNEIAENAKVCPHCGTKGKMPFYKKWWFWGIIVFVVVIIFSAGGESETDTNNNENYSSEKDSENEEMSIVESYQWIAENSFATFEITDASIAFMNEHKEFFPGSEKNSGAISDYVNWEIGYPQLAKSINKHTGELIAVGGYVIDIDEAEDGSITFFQITGYDGNDYCFYYLGVLDEVFEETEVYVYALPLDIITFENMGGAYTEAIVGAACYVQTELYN